MSLFTRDTIYISADKQTYLKFDPGTDTFTLVVDGTQVMSAKSGGAVLDSRHVDIGDNTAYTVLAENSGKVHTIPDLTGDLTISLPTPAAGLYYEFWYAGVAADAQDWAIDTGSNTNFLLGGLLQVDDAPAADSAAPNGSSNSIVNVLTPEPGTVVKLACDGTNWILSGTVASANAPTFADQS